MKPQPTPQMSRGMLDRLMKPTNDIGNQKATSSTSAPGLSKKSMKYQKSMLGSQHVPKGVDAQKVQNNSSSQLRKHVQTGQNRPSAGFKEPPNRGYNPYS